MEWRWYSHVLSNQTHPRHMLETIPKTAYSNSKKRYKSWKDMMKKKHHGTKKQWKSVFYLFGAYNSGLVTVAPPQFLVAGRVVTGRGVPGSPGFLLGDFKLSMGILGSENGGLVAYVRPYFGDISPLT